MSQKEKRIQKLLNKPAEASFEMVHLILKDHGWERRNPGSSHYTYCKDGEREIITLSVHRNKVKKYSIQEVIRILGLEVEG